MIFYKPCTDSPTAPPTCGGTSKILVRRSTHRKSSVQGIMKKMPGPLALPSITRPRRKMTARSYSRTTPAGGVCLFVCLFVFIHFHFLWLEGVGYLISILQQIIVYQILLLNADTGYHKGNEISFSMMCTSNTRDFDLLKNIK